MTAAVVSVSSPKLTALRTASEYEDVVNKHHNVLSGRGGVAIAFFSPKTP